jgi:hypothetical protein
MHSQIVEQAVDLFTLIEGLPAGPQRSQGLLNIQLCVAQFDAQTALTLRGRLTNSPAGTSSLRSGGIKTNGVGRFNTTPPTPIFANPTLATTTSEEGAVVVVNDEAPQDEVPQDEAVLIESQVEPLYQKIATMTSEQVLNLYGESAIEGMIVQLGKTIASSKRPGQKATFLLNLVRQKVGQTEMAADESI